MRKLFSTDCMQDFQKFIPRKSTPIARDILIESNLENSIYKR